MRIPKRIEAVFYQQDSGREPVRDFLLGISPKEDRIKINADIRTVEYGWPIGMPTCRPLADGICEVRTNLTNRIARVLFYIDRRSKMVLLSGFIKKTESTPADELKTALRRKKAHEAALGDK
ncbi:type II toxin-antitoxin system RelE/ParE family toxin [Gluconobacter aidae]|uniref:Type II toxin-antitoxin system RelE/ParE family toxin n=1 Tax=Gluconobacter aidae TaxID=2662454 RepID=A0A7X1VQA6_9PROT|nr:type II toxin-antitoxin system RelE/ParE family toxin [Gluconobacter aidae]MQS00183.1 type II toxin-antitoxin system RelE/ParE family toxin [Gluconobacter aidae]